MQAALKSGDQVLRPCGRCAGESEGRVTPRKFVPRTSLEECAKDLYTLLTMERELASGRFFAGSPGFTEFTELIQTKRKILALARGE